MKRVAIIGAGIAGLSTAFYLQRLSAQEGSPLDIHLLEKTRLGGSIVTEEHEGFVMEGGPDCFLAEKRWASRLCHELGLDNEIIGTNPSNRRAFILWNNTLHPLPEGFILLVPTSFWPFVRSSFLSLTGKLRMALDLVLPRKHSDADESLAVFVRRRLGNEALERIAEPLVAGIHAGDPETMSLLSTFPRFADLEQRYRSLIWGMYRRRRTMHAHATTSSPPSMFLALRRGLGQMVDALESTLSAVTITVGEEVQQLHRTSKTAPGEPGYALTMSGAASALPCHAVVSAAPAYVSAGLLRHLDAELSDVLASIPYTSTATINLAYRRQHVDHPLDGYGFVVPSREGRTIMATTFSSVKFEGRARDGDVLLRSFVGGAKRGDLVSLSDDALLRAVRNDVEAILSIRGDPHLTHICRWPAAMPQYTLEYPHQLATINEHLEQLPGIFLTGSAYAGIGISDCIRHGRDVAEQVQAYVVASPASSAKPAPSLELME
jgi:oxygen-dependent protoporphyrinogen oxidase